VEAEPEIMLKRPNQCRPMKSSRRALLRRLMASRRGVVSVLSMMFVILFGSLAAAMAIMSRSNITTAATHQHVMRAMGAAETGMAVGQARLIEAVSRFMVERGSVDGDFGRRLWTGAFSAADGVVQKLPPRSFEDPGTPTGLAHALEQVHDQDQNTVVHRQTGFISQAARVSPPNVDPDEYYPHEWVFTPAVAIDQQNGPHPRGVAFQIRYALLANGTDVRVFVTGFDFDYETRGDAVTRSIVQDFRIVKRVNAAVVSPSKIMIGRNVMVEGDLGATFTDVQHDFGDPIIMKSDFYGLEPGLDAELDKLFDALALYDVDKDNRLRIDHPIEGQNLPDYSNLGYPGTSADVTGDGYLDEFDVFIMYYDADRDGQVVLSSDLTAGTPAQGRTPEFTLDDQLARLIDSARPDRNRNGISGFIDNSGDGKFDPRYDELLDYEVVDPASVPSELQSYIRSKSGQSVLYRDQVLGYRDGVIDRRDQYAKVTGRLVFRVTEGQWAAAQGNYMERVQGPIRNDYGLSPMLFGAEMRDLPDLSPATFTNSQTALKAAANGDPFLAQVAQNLGVSVPALETWDPANNPAAPDAPRYFPLRPDTTGDGLPDNWDDPTYPAYFERMPFGSPSFYDWYYRPVYENMTFRNVEIPIGGPSSPINNGLFINCTFIGVTYVRTTIGNLHPNWTLYGRMSLDPQHGRPVHYPPREEYTGTEPPTMLAPHDIPILMADPPLDKADIPDDEKHMISNYASLPDPLIDPATNKRIINTKYYSNNLRFHDCLFVGSIVGDNSDLYTNTRNKVQFTGKTRFSQQHPTDPNSASLNPDPQAMDEIRKSSLMLPNYSVDIGNFNSPQEQDVRLQGAIVAGVLDVRGNASIHGALLLTFNPIPGQPPLADVLGNPIGNPALFNATIGYFGPDDGDEESLDPATLPLLNGVKIVGWDLCDPRCDGMADLGPWDSPTQAQLQAGATPVPFHGFGAISLRFDPNMGLPDGIILPLQIQARRSTYREGVQ
jgi:hypothetical protein